MKQFAKKTAKFVRSSGDDELSQNETEIHASGKSAFISHASHEIQGAFFGVSSICGLLKRSVGNREETETLLDHLQGACNMYKYKLSNFLEYTRFEAGFKDSLVETLNIRYLLSKVVDENQYAANERKITISLFISDVIPEQIISNEFRIAQICGNLLHNAIQYSPAGGSVLVKIETEGVDDWAIVVEDKGEGMTAGQAGSVFEFSAEERKSLKNPGGLGLLVTRYLAEDILRGKIFISSQPDKGTRCKVILPLNEK